MTRQQDERTIRISGPLTALSATAAIKADQLQVRINQGLALPSMQVHDQIAEVSNEVNESLRAYIKQLEKAQAKMINLIRQNTGNRGQQNSRRQAAANSTQQKKGAVKATTAKASQKPAEKVTAAKKPTPQAKSAKGDANKAETSSPVAGGKTTAPADTKAKAKAVAAG